MLDGPGNLGTVQVRGGDELASIQRQVGLVIDRLRRTGQLPGDDRPQPRDAQRDRPLPRSLPAQFNQRQALHDLIAQRFRHGQ